MASKPKVRVAREQPGGIDPFSAGRRSGVRTPAAYDAAWAGRMAAAQAGAKEVMVKITGGGRDADGVQAHMEYVDRHGELEVETDRGAIEQGREAGTRMVNDWGLGYSQVPGSAHSRRRDKDGRPQQARQAFNIVLSMPAGTPPEKVLAAARKFARENFANQHRYAMTLHTNDAAWNRKHNPGFANKREHGKHPHVHLIVKAEHEYGGPRLNPRKADLRAWRGQFADYMSELGVAATATQRADRGLVQRKNPPVAIYRAVTRQQTGRPVAQAQAGELYTEAGDSKFMRRKLNAIRKELRERGTVDDQKAYQALLSGRSAVEERYRATIGYLIQHRRHEEARRFALALQALPPVRTENQWIAAALLAQRQRTPQRTPAAHGPSR